MAIRLGIFCIVLVILAATNTSLVRAVEEFKVGDAEGWRPPVTNDTEIYNQWAARRRFHVGDSLRFEYKNGSVLVVDKWAYYHCNTSNPISTFNDGNTIVKLDGPGPMYFTSGDPDHCKDGQRLEIQVIPLHPISHSPPSAATPPQPYSAESPSQSPLSSSGVSVSATVISVLTAIIAALGALVYFSP